MLLVLLINHLIPISLSLMNAIKKLPKFDKETSIGGYKETISSVDRTVLGQ